MLLKGITFLKKFYFIRGMKLFSFVAILFLFSCAEKPKQTITIGVLEGPSAISFIQMIAQPMYFDGLKLEIIIKKEPQQIQALMMQNELDFAILPTVMAANLYNKGVDFRMLACPIWGTLYLMSNDKSFMKFEDISGQTVSAFGQGATTDILLQHIALKKQIHDVNFDYTFSTNREVAQALITEKTKLAVVSEPLVSTLLYKYPNIKIVSKINCEEFMINTDRDIFVQTAFLVNHKFIDRYHHIIPKIVEAYAKSCNFINDSQNEAAELLVSRNFYPNTSIAKISLPLCNIRYVAAFALDKELHRYLKIFYDYDPKSIGGKIPDRSFIYTSF